MIYGGMACSNYQGRRYRLYLENDIVTLYSLNIDEYPDIPNLRKSEVTNAYRTKVWIRVRGCDAIYSGVKNGLIILDVRPGEDVYILNAKEIDRGIFRAEIPVEEIEKAWEERRPYLDFQFPLNLKPEVKIDIDKFLH